MEQQLSEVLSSQPCSSALAKSFQRQPSTSSSSSAQQKPAYIAVYQEKYGSLENLCKELSFAEIWKLANDMDSALTSDVPSFVRLDETYPNTPKGASVAWLYSHLKNLLVSSGVLKGKISDEQIDILASVIVANYPSMKLTEFMLFETYFLGGRYSAFYGETSYIMAITRSLYQFRAELNGIYWRIERDQSEAAKKEPFEGISREDWLRHRQALLDRWDACKAELVGKCHDASARGVFEDITFLSYEEGRNTLTLQVTKESYDILEGKMFSFFCPILLAHYPKVTLLYRLKAPAPSVPQKKEDPTLATACCILANSRGWDKETIENASYAFRRRYKCSPEQYVKRHETVKSVSQDSPSSLNTPSSPNSF